MTCLTIFHVKSDILERGLQLFVCGKCDAGWLIFDLNILNMFVFYTVSKFFFSFLFDTRFLFTRKNFVFVFLFLILASYFVFFFFSIDFSILIGCYFTFSLISKISSVFFYIILEISSLLLYALN